MSSAPLSPPTRAGLPAAQPAAPALPARTAAPDRAGEQFRALLDTPPAEVTPLRRDDGAGRAATPDAATGAQVRQQQQWAQAQRDLSPDGAATLPSSNGLAPSVGTPAAADAVRSPAAGDDFVALLQSHCARLYVATGSQAAGPPRMLLELGQTLPGALVELAREGAFLRVRLHAGDPQAAELMDTQRARLISALERSTQLGVVVDVVRPG